ncbi:MAG: endolytic transglycosylase MltG [Candidatus Buchananbacteria bacterium]
MLKKVISLILLVGVLVTGGSVAYYFYDIDAPNSNNSNISKFIIPEGWGSTKISQELAKAGLVNNFIVFEMYVWLSGISSSLLPGEYDLAGNLSIRQVAKILSKGNTNLSKEVSLTFIEGWNNKDVSDYLVKNNIISADDFYGVIEKKADWWDQYEFLQTKPKNLDLEGYLFPDTYRIYRDATAKDIVAKMLDNFDKKFTAELRQEIKKQGKTIHDIVTLASVIEKEVSTEVDRKMVADIFYRRLKIGMPLQSDATVNYVTGDNALRPTYKDISVDNLYNTYKHKGLPPGPICNPGMSAILAAIYPTPNQYYYFLTTPDGQVIYSKTNEEHAKAKAKYLK